MILCVIYFVLMVHYTVLYVYMLYMLYVIISLVYKISDKANDGQTLNIFK